jgi:hypothetical protein
MTFDDVVTEMAARFTSANAIPVERATIKRGEWETVLREIADLRHDLERSMNNHVADLNP